MTIPHDPRTTSAGDGDPGARAGDPELRQLRRRYEALRDDYEDLVERLADVEAQLRRPPQEETRSPDPSAPAEGSLREQVRHVVSMPWFQLRDEYAQTADDLQTIIRDMDELAGRAFKGQHGPRHTSEHDHEEQERRPHPLRHSQEHEGDHGFASRGPRRARMVEVQVHSLNLGALLDFQERLSNLPEVARVSMSQVNEDRAMLIVELEEDGGRSPGG